MHFIYQTVLINSSQTLLKKKTFKISLLLLTNILIKYTFLSGIINNVQIIILTITTDNNKILLKKSKIFLPLLKDILTKYTSSR
jgi:hypothetical protein